ncbi:outer membrane lipoprotein LolB [Stenoxybacter acetivorans]|uniref:outer membrane lipoprotein LolB n=1 Tax=Stenoxybacter acetivorans TaxID=422441 RepID=UPI0005657FED|nr:outer membrane lipoprotein LolB [Stenoxybacter acetivorans]
MLLKHWHNTALLSLAVLLLAACTSLSEHKTTAQWHAAPNEISDFYSNGRLSVQQNGKGSSAHFEWSNVRGVQEIDVSTPLGNVVGALCRDYLGLLARNSEGQTIQATDTQALSQKLLGFSLPLDHLDIWLNGYWVNNEPHHVLADGRLSQSGWLISRRVQTNNNAPKMLLLEKPDWSIRLIFDEFTSSLDSDAKINVCAWRENTK